MINNITVESRTPSAFRMGNVWPCIFALPLSVNPHRRPARVKTGKRTGNRFQRALWEWRR